jgi:hypothetical protein
MPITARRLQKGDRHRKSKIRHPTDARKRQRAGGRRRRRRPVPLASYGDCCHLWGGRRCEERQADQRAARAWCVARRLGAKGNETGMSFRFNVPSRAVSRSVKDSDCGPAAADRGWSSGCSRPATGQRRATSGVPEGGKGRSFEKKAHSRKRILFFREQTYRSR